MQYSNRDPCYLYILYSDKLEKYYTGISRDPEERLLYHNTSQKGWTKRGRPWKLIFTLEFSDRISAQRAERFVKSQKSKGFIKKLISGEYHIQT